MSTGTPDVDALAELKALVHIIQSSITAIESTLLSKETTFPSPKTPFTVESEGVRQLPEVKQACSLIVSAATQLVSAVRSPGDTIMSLTLSYNLCASLGVAVAANAVESCREAGTKGAHVNDIARASSIDPTKLARVLRTLATNHIFTEVAPDVFANNRLSSVMDTGKSVKELVEHPEAKCIGTAGAAAGIGHCMDEMMKGASFLQEALLDPQLAKSEEPTATAFNVAFNTKVPLFEWYEAKGNEQRRIRFGTAMQVANSAMGPATAVEGFDWNSLAKDSLVVDVGGGVGAQSLTLAQKFPHLRFAIQDREQITKDGATFWNAHMPEAITLKRVEFQAQDFFSPQPNKDAAAFLLRNILHDWSDSYCLKILRPLRAAAAPSTRLMIVEHFISYACIEEQTKTIPGAERPPLPAPLLPNGGNAAITAYLSDIQMMLAANGKERTLTQLRELLGQAGWKLVHVYQGPQGYGMQMAVAVPA